MKFSILTSRRLAVVFLIAALTCPTVKYIRPAFAQVPEPDTSESEQGDPDVECDGELSAQIFSLGIGSKEYEDIPNIFSDPFDATWGVRLHGKAAFINGRNSDANVQFGIIARRFQNDFQEDENGEIGERNPENNFGGGLGPILANNTVAAKPKKIAKCDIGKIELVESKQISDGTYIVVGMAFESIFNQPSDLIGDDEVGQMEAVMLAWDYRFFRLNPQIAKP